MVPKLLLTNAYIYAYRLLCVRFSLQKRDKVCTGRLTGCKHWECTIYPKDNNDLWSTGFG